jgi:ATP-dependent RNA helicase DeaD
MKEFQKLGLDSDIIDIVKKLDYKKPTEIQEKAIPKIIAKKDVIAQSATGTGKTFAFLSGVLQILDKNKKANVIVLTPTRELANQIYAEARTLTKNKKVFSTVVFGGMPINKQIDELKRAVIVIGTPGRVLDHLNRKTLNLNNTDIVILDEADRMCDMGFYKDITEIIDSAKNRKQMLLFSATITKDVNQIERKYMKKPEIIKVQHLVDPTKLLQEYYIIKSSEKISLLLHLLKTEKKKSIVFCNTRDEVDLIYNNLKKHNLEVYKIHGGLEQNRRTNITKNYKENKTAILISTDVSARGIHIEDLEHIYNFDLPKENNQYIHRIGRTARAGKDGKAISLLSVREEIEFVGMAKSFGFKLKAIKTPGFERIQIEHLEKKQRTNKQSNRRSNSSFSNKTNNRKSNNKSFGNKKNVNFVSFKDVSNLQRRPNRFRKN